MTDSLPLPPVLRRMESEATLFTKLSEFQAQATSRQPVPPHLLAVLDAAAPAFAAGFAYTAAHWNGELTVTLHYAGAELGSSAVASINDYTDTCARLLAGLLGIPLATDDQPAEPEPSAPATAVCGLPPVQLQQDAPAVVEDAHQEPAAAASEPDATPSEPAEDIHRQLSEGERETAIGMIKVMPPDQRKAFTKTFRDVFQVPADAKQVAPFITELRHLQFIDRYTVEASGGIAA